MSNLVRLMVEHWKYYVILQRDKHAQELRADVHFSASLLPKYFNLWTQYVQYRQWKHDINQQAANQFRWASILYNASKFLGTMEIVEFSIWIFLDLDIFYIVNKIRNCRSHCVLCMTSQLLVWSSANSQIIPYYPRGVNFPGHLI